MCLSFESIDTLPQTARHHFIFFPNSSLLTFDTIFWWHCPNQILDKHINTKINSVFSSCLEDYKTTYIYRVRNTFLISNTMLRSKGSGIKRRNKHYKWKTCWVKSTIAPKCNKIHTILMKSSAYLSLPWTFTLYRLPLIFTGKFWKPPF